MLLILLVLLMLSAVALGLYLASRGLHPKQLRRRRMSHANHAVHQEMPVKCLTSQCYRDPTGCRAERA